MKMSNLIAGLQLLQSYFTDPDSDNTGVGYEILYVYATDKPLSEDDVKKLQDLGWHQPEVEEDDDGNSPYDPEERWGAYT
jgi:hypothetical protein